MEINFNTANTSPDELTALIALCASLGGRLPTQLTKWTAVVERPEAPAVGPGNSWVEQTGEDASSEPTAAQMGESAPPPPPPAATDGAVDSKGIPWDARIHSESKATVADGSWRKRRGVDDAVFAEVMAELTAGASGNDAAPPPPPAESEAPLAPAAGNLSAFADFPGFVSAVSKHGKNYADLNELAGSVGVAAFKDMKDHADKWDLFFSMLG